MVLADLGSRLTDAISNLSKTNVVDQEFVESILKEVCNALLASDVNVQLVVGLRKNIRAKINLAEIPQHSRKRAVHKAIFDELVALVDCKSEPFQPKKGKSNVIMMVGLQGSGKTTTCTKLAVWYQRRGFKTGLVCADTFRAGAFDQLKQNASKAQIPYYGSYTETDPVVVAKEGVQRLKKAGFDIIIVDTSGRHQQERELFTEMQQISAAVKPHQTIMILDASIGQAAESQSTAFKESSDFGAIIITKMDGHAKGGGAISAVAATNTPIAFIGTGEHNYDLEKFAPKSFIQKLLGMGDMEGLFDQIQTFNIDQKETMKHIQKGIFTLRDLRDNMTNIMKMGPLSKVAGMIPGMGQLANQLGSDGDTDYRMKRVLYIFDSMTEAELDSDGKILASEPSRIMRIAKGSGTSVKDVYDLLEQQKIMANMAKKMGGKNGMLNRMQQAKAAGGAGGPGGLGANPMAAAQAMARNNPEIARAMQQMQNNGGMPDMQSLMKMMGGKF
ncbi:hypothetical protein CANCADRAFT_31167 [Tortispora caseinolytica NRRL Y-17796]|uniref:Signal recognition particle 54 kDa protein n=1 Tax=Tortispora caseinolytica NRRL Y-17796 TaxID=767744 RepID=A0A1E4TEF3_9ASCO|nr:hypothetical protein CANCADRAFT_31167 [Tortispora caseinolytica NRRL Y-17796]